MTKSTRLRSLGLLITALSSLAVLTACVEAAARNTPGSPTVTSTPAPEVTPTAPVTVSPTASPTPTATPTATATAGPTATATSLPVNHVDYYPLFLEVESLGDENVVRGNIVIVRGQTLPDAILSINGVIVEIDAEGRFEREIRLDYGPNVLEVIASDLEDNVKSRVILIVALPEATPTSTPTEIPPTGTPEGSPTSVPSGTPVIAPTPTPTVTATPEGPAQ